MLTKEEVAEQEAAAMRLIENRCGASSSYATNPSLRQSDLELLAAAFVRDDSERILEEAFPLQSAALSAVADRMGVGEEPVTEEWLREIGIASAPCKAPPGEWLVAIYWMDGDWDVALCNEDDWHLLPVKLQTRADVLNLCQALGVPVKKERDGE